jgi:peptide/nickel transport system ATP-binding protein
VKPEIIIFDEAVSALDVSVRAQILDLIAELCRSLDLTYIFISHDLSVVRTITDKVMVMENGKIIEYGNTEKILTNPAHEYTVKLIEAAPSMPSFS